jgi:hypothetical protein
MKKHLTCALALLSGLLLQPAWGAQSCQIVAQNLNQQLGRAVDANEVASMLISLNKTERLPEKFVTKRQAKEAGWRPGKSLWNVPELHGKSIGGDRFGNFEKRVPDGKWKEADLSYRGGKRNANRMIYAESGRRFVTVDHYRTFTEIPSCQ